MLTQGLKRSISGDLGQETKKIMFRQGNSEQKYNYVADASMPVTSVQTTTISTSRNIGNDVIPEIPDEELLQMALAFEKEQEQLVEKKLGNNFEEQHLNNF